jgi:hypothetical protein
MRLVKWCLSFGIVLAGVVVGYCRPCHEADLAPLPAIWPSFDGGCCEEGCDCDRHGCDPNQAFGINPYHLGNMNPPPGFFRDGGPDFPNPVGLPTSEELNAMQAAEAEKAAKLMR